MPDVLMTLGAPRYRCHGCGRCCTGPPRPVRPDERAAIEARAAELGVAEPIRDGRLRHEAGACVLLDGDRRCALHLGWGPEAKPLACRRYPLDVVRTESELRYAVDPAAWATARTWTSGPPLALEPGPEVPVRTLAGPAREVELALLRATLQDEASVAGVLHLLAGRSAGDRDLPEGLSARLRAALRTPELARGVAALGPLRADDLGPLLVRIATLDETPPPPWPGLLPPELEALALESLRRLLFLRVHPTRITAVLVLSGVVALAWTDRRPEGFATGLAAWCALVRSGGALCLAPSPEQLRWLATGEVL